MPSFSGTTALLCACTASLLASSIDAQQLQRQQRTTSDVIRDGSSGSTDNDDDDDVATAFVASEEEIVDIRYRWGPLRPLPTDRDRTALSLFEDDTDSVISAAEREMLVSAEGKVNDSTQQEGKVRKHNPPHDAPPIVGGRSNLQGAKSSDEGEGTKNPLMTLFPSSTAPTFFGRGSELLLNREFQPWARDKKWHPDLNEADVFHATLEHRSVTERSWEVGVGKGGQLYSMYGNSFGEAMAPSTPQSQWNDEVWQMTTIYGSLMPYDLPDNPVDGSKFANPFVHQSGIYTPAPTSEPFYSPILGEDFDPDERAYSVLSWGQVPSPSINRSGVLTYVRYRDLGGGVLEVSYVVYNFEEAPMSNLGPWGGARTSAFPEHVLSNPDGTYRYFSPWSYGYDKFEGSQIQMDQTGGWAAVTKNADDPHSHAIGVVFGTDLDKEGEHRGKPRYDVGDSRHGKRDYTVQATVVDIKDTPGTAHALRMYFVMGTLDRVADKCNQLVEHAKYEPLNITEANAPRIPLYAKEIGQDAVLSRERPADASQRPACEAYARPVMGSMPLFVMANVDTGRHFLTSDPYAQCSRDPFPNPLDPSDANYAKYKNRSIYRPYEKSTGWVELLGFVMPKEKASLADYDYLALSDVGAIGEDSFDAGEKLDAANLMVLTSSK